MTIDFNFAGGDFKATTATITPLTQRARDFLNVDVAVQSFTVRKSALNDILLLASHEGLTVEEL